MALKCDVCGKKTAHGDQHMHRHSRWRFKAPRTKRTWAPNIRSLKLTDSLSTLNLSVCMSCYKRYQKDGLAFLKRKSVKGVNKLNIAV